MNYFEIFYIYIDDEREPLMNYSFWAKNFNEAVTAIETYCTPNYTSLVIDFDYDLGEEKTGYDIAKWCIEHGWTTGKFRIHSMNPVGILNIRQLLTHYGWEEFGFR